MAVFIQNDEIWHSVAIEIDAQGNEIITAPTDEIAHPLVADKGMTDILAYGLDLYADALQGGWKRLFDLLFGALLLILTAPLLICAMSAVWLSSLGREPVIYRQTRVGLYGRPITLLKLRTMRVDAEQDGPRMAARSDPRITRLGRILRRSRIDELPQLINILRGDMSLIGPRPERPEFVVQYERQIEGYGLRHRVKPGITGLAQVRYSYGETLEDAAAKLYFDLDYIRRYSPRTDLVILLQTLPVVLTGWGAR